MKLDRQNLDRGLALWLMAVIVAIAGFCMSSPASAHSGHGQDSGTHVVRVEASVSLEARMVRADIAGPGMRMTMSVLRAEHHSGCSGPCCTAPCGATCCCAIGLVPAEGDAASARGLTDPIPLGPISARTDVAPDSPSEPPRPFA